MTLRALAFLLLAAAAPLPAAAGELCNMLSAQGNYDAAAACRLDEGEQEMRREELDRRRHIDESIRRAQEETDAVLRRLELDDRLRELRDRR